MYLDLTDIESMDVYVDGEKVETVVSGCCGIFQFCVLTPTDW